MNNLKNNSIKILSILFFLSSMMACGSGLKTQLIQPNTSTTGQMSLEGSRNVGPDDVMRNLLTSMLKELENDPFKINQTSRPHERTALHCAVFLGDIETAQYLLLLGADVTATDKDGQTPLHLAARYGHEQIVKVLMKLLGTNVNIKDAYSYTPLHWAVENGHTEILSYLIGHVHVNGYIENYHGISPLLLAIHKGRLDLVEILLKSSNIDIKRPNRFGETPLFLATRLNRVEILQFLLTQRGIEVNQIWRESTPLHLAAENGYVAIVDILLQKLEQIGGDINIQNQAGSTPLLLAVINHHLAVVERLLQEKNINLNSYLAPDTPFTKAVFNQDWDIARALFKKDSSVIRHIPTSYPRAQLRGRLSMKSI